MLHRMKDLQSIAFMPFAYDHVAHRDGSKEKLKEIEAKKKIGNREQNLIEFTLRINKPEQAEATDTEQDSQQQGKEGPSCKHRKIRLFCFVSTSGTK